MRAAVEQMPKKPGSPGKTKKNSNRKQWELDEGWLILLANIWIVAFMALIHRVECNTGPAFEIPFVGRTRGKRAEKSECVGRETTACLHCVFARSFEKRAENSGIKMSGDSLVE